MGNPVLRVEHLHFDYDSGFSLKDITVSFYKGEKVAILGSNGSGKSTFFLNMNGVLSHADGDIFLDDVKITSKNINELRRAVGIVFQDPDSQMIASTVESEVAFGPINLGLKPKDAEARANNAIKRMNIEHLKERPVHYLSGGQKKSVSIADILAMEPRVIIFDEPTASLDPVSCEMFEGVLEDIGRQEVTTLISTHDVDFAWRWADRVIVFHDGEIIADSIPDKIFADEELLKKAKLKKPIMAEICELLSEKGIIPVGELCKSVESLKELLK